jgi:hypothetical protein
VSPQQFGAVLLQWHDFFLATAGATAALLGLLFVGVSINLSAITAAERIDLRARAAQAFANLVFVLVVSLLMLVPNPEPTLLAAGLAATAGIGLPRVASNVAVVVRARGGPNPPISLRSTLRRIGWTAIADLILLFTAWRIWTSQGQAEVIPNLIGVVFVLMIGAADVAWEMLTEVSRERQAR